MTDEEARALKPGTKIEVFCPADAGWHEATFKAWMDPSSTGSYLLAVFSVGSTGYVHALEVVNEEGRAQFNLNVSDRVLWVLSKNVRAVQAKGADGLFCVDCGEFYYMAVANHARGLVCYSCRDSNQWKWG